jgi:hypothetical protein
LRGLEFGVSLALDWVFSIHDESRQQSKYTEEHLHQIVTLEAQACEHHEIQLFTSRLTRLKNQASNYHIELNNITNTLIPAITSTIKQQQELTKQLAEENDIKKVQQIQQNNKMQ